MRCLGRDKPGWSCFPAPATIPAVSRYLANRWVRIAIGLFALGLVPLALVTLLAAIAPWLAAALPFATLLWMITFWPAVLLLAAGIVQVRGSR